MPSYKNFTASILDPSTSRPLQEYMTSHNPLTNTCQTYIESYHNQPFTIVLRDDSLAPQTPSMFSPPTQTRNGAFGRLQQSDGVFGRSDGFDTGSGDPRFQGPGSQGTAVYVDGVYVDNGLTGPGIAIERRWYGKRVDHVHVMPFIFKENTSESTAIWDAGEIGTIHLILRRCTVGSIAQDQTNRGCVPEDVETPPVRHLHNREDYLAHRIEFSSPRELPATLYHVTWLDNPPTPQSPSFLEFKFIYRSRQVLISQGIIPGPLPHIKREPLGVHELGDGMSGGDTFGAERRGMGDMGVFEVGGNDLTGTAVPKGGMLKENDDLKTPTRKRKPRTTKKSKKDTETPLPTPAPQMSTSPTPMPPPGSATTAPPSSPPETNPRTKRSRPNAKSKGINKIALNSSMDVSSQYSGVEMQSLGGSIPSSPIEAAMLRRTTNVFRQGGMFEFGNEGGNGDGITTVDGIEEVGSGSGGKIVNGQSMGEFEGIHGLEEGNQFEILKELRELREEVKRLKEQRYSTTQDFPSMNPYHILARPTDQSQYTQQQQKMRENTVEVQQPPSENK